MKPRSIKIKARKHIENGANFPMEMSKPKYICGGTGSYRNLWL
uniref:Uncharacterized protein n=1 Tax=Geladintestivirus 3 TaxID=3233135 RepID=A0AAU8MGZ2_9CAUD